jgi:hypothetical protein
MKGLIKGQKGQALVVALIVLVVGSLILTPLLGLMGTGIKSGQVFEQKDDETYAADAGVEDAMWHIRYDTLNATLSGRNYSEYDYSTTYSYPYNLFLNDKDVTVNISNVWIPTGISTPSKQQAQQIIDDEKLIIIGYPDAAASTYDIKIVYYYQGSYSSSPLKVKTLGIWLSSGYQYVTGSCSLAGKYSSETVSSYKGGCAVVWSFTSTDLSTFPTSGTPGSSPLVKIFTFKYSGPQGQIPELVASWIDTTGVPGTSPTYSCSWDDSIRLYHIVSQAGAVQIDAYGAKTKFRKLKSAVSGDYFGTGNSLITGTEDGDNNIHYLLQRYTQATIATNDNDDTLGIPSDATIDAAYLYWTGWIDWNTYNPSGSQTRYPTGDYSHSGTWDKTTNMYSYVDEQGTNDGDTTYLLHGTTNGSALFNFPVFSVPTGMAITGLTVSLVAKDYNCFFSCSNDMRPAIRVGGTNYLTTAPSSDVPFSYDTISYTWTTNPKTNLPWTQDDINGVGSNALQDFGVYSSDANPQIRLTQVYATVGWGSPSLKYPDNPTQQDLQVLVEDTARVNKVYFKGGTSTDTLVTTHDWQTLSPDVVKNLEGGEGTWFYTCKADVTDLLKGWIGNGTIPSNGAGGTTYTVSHVAAPNQADPTYSFSFASGGGSTGYPLGTPAPQQWSPPSRYCLSHAGWSLLILYHCASVYNHQFYLYDIDTPGFAFFAGWNGGSSSPCTIVDPDWDNDGNPGGTVSGFLVPPRSGAETNAARITVMVGEGDKADGSSGNCYCKDRFKVNGTALPDGTGLYDVWNGNSRGLPANLGIDIDQFFVTWSSNILKPMDVSAQISVSTGVDCFTMSYMLLQFRSELGPGGVITNYAIKIN